MKTSLSVEVFDSLHELLGLFRSCMRKSLVTAHPELTFNEMRLLMRIGEHPGITQKDLVEHSRIDKAQMARTLARLQEQGWLERSPSENDKRVRSLRLSPEGCRLYASLRQLRATVADQLLVDCPADLQANLRLLLRQACDSAQQHIGASDSPGKK